jgi:hypothetical protein
MRKKCVSCGLIAFAADEVCRRCGSDKLFKYSEPDKLPETAAVSKKNLSALDYFICLIFSCVFEFAAIFPILANLGWSHTSGGRPESSILEKIYVLVIIITHIPSLIVGGLLSLFIGESGFFLTPIIQIIFWTFLISHFWRKIQNKLR